MERDGVNGVRIRYSLEIGDIMQFARFHFRKSPAARRMFLLQLILWPLFVFFAGYMIGTASDPLTRAIPAVAGALFVAATIPWVHSRSITRQVRKMYEEGPTVGLFGVHTLAIEEDGLRESSEGGEQFARWPAIYRVVESDTHAFIYLSPVLAHVIPRASLDPPLLAAFLDEVRKRAVASQRAEADQLARPP